MKTWKWLYNSTVNLSTRWRRVVSIPPLLLYFPGETAPEIHCIGGEAGPRAGMDVREKEKSLAPAEN
jgi:hypothetical protein